MIFVQFIIIIWRLIVCLKKIKVVRFRALKHIEINNSQQLNLLVGKSNSLFYRIDYKIDIKIFNEFLNPKEVIAISILID